MKQTKTIFLALLVIILSSCSSNDDDENVTLTVKNKSNLHAPSDLRDHETGEILEVRPYVYFSFETEEIVTQTANWDIAFKGTNIITNSGINGDAQAAAVVLVGTLSDITEAPADNEFNVDTQILNAIPSGSGNGWYNYNPTTHAITPIPGRVLVFKTHNGNYAKMEILSYYKDATTTPQPEDSDYYTFNYVYQDNGSKEF